MKKSMYLAARLLSSEDRVVNLNWATNLSKKFDVYLPQRDGGLYTDLVNHSGMRPEQAAKRYTSIPRGRCRVARM